MIALVTEAALRVTSTPKKLPSCYCGIPEHTFSGGNCGNPHRLQYATDALEPLDEHSIGAIDQPGLSVKQ